jgi:peptidoglycan hydrolase-like protein with peptidoglycan-binding domain
MTIAFDAEDLARAQRFAHSQVGDPYKWGGGGPNGFDCSGFMSALLNALENRNNFYVRRFSTGTIASSWDDLGFGTGKGDANDFSIGVIYPWESSSGIGHCAGTLAGLNVESRGSAGVLVGAAARGTTSPLFRHHFHLAVASPAVQAWPAWPGRYLKLATPPMSGEDVRKWQAQLHHRGWPLDVDGAFGTQTNHQTRAFQREQGLEVDGVVGPASWKAAFTAPLS